MAEFTTFESTDDIPPVAIAPITVRLTADFTVSPGQDVEAIAGIWLQFQEEIKRSAHYAQDRSDGWSIMTGWKIGAWWDQTPAVTPQSKVEA